VNAFKNSQCLLSSLSDSILVRYEVRQPTVHSVVIYEGVSFQFYASNNKKEHGLRIPSWTRYRPSAYFFLCGSIGRINWPFRLATLSINLNSRRAANIHAPCIIPFFLHLLYPFQSPCRFLSKFSVSLHFFQSILKSLFCHLFVPPASERKISKHFTQVFRTAWQVKF